MRHDQHHPSGVRCIAECNGLSQRRKTPNLSQCFNISRMSEQSVLLLLLLFLISSVVYNSCDVLKIKRYYLLIYIEYDVNTHICNGLLS